MSKIKFNVKESDEYTIVSFEIEGVISPEDLAALIPPKVDGSKGVILSGRGPVWLYCFLTHFYHPTKFIATYDPRLGGAVIVETHSVEYAIGSVLNCCQGDKEESA
jgi:CRISPR-associated protein Csx3